MAEITPEVLRQLRQKRLEYYVRNLRPGLRRKGISAEKRARIRSQIDDAMAELRDDFGVHEVTGWRAYPKSLQFGYRADHSGMQAVEPPKRGKRKKDHAPATRSGGDLLAALGASVGADLNGSQT